ncbi:unnamed protein product, partial [Cyprideis torosa]
MIAQGLDEAKLIVDQCFKSALAINILSDEKRKQIVEAIGESLLANKQKIVEANEKDLALLPDTDPKKDRLLLNEKRIEDMAKSAREIAAMDDPSQKVLERTLENGLKLEKHMVPIGVVGVIYESRPNVTVDIALLTLRSGNAAVLKGGKEAWESNRCLVGLIKKVLKDHQVDEATVSLLGIDRSHTQYLLSARGLVDVIIPRGSDELIQYVRENSSVPVIETGAGVCHTYVEASADVAMASKLIINAKTQRPAVCNAMDTMILDAKIAEGLLSQVADGLKAYDVQIFADDRSYDILSSLKYPFLDRAQESDFGKEFLSFACSVKVIDGFEEALEHIRKYSSKHSETIVTENSELAEIFLRK